MTPTAGRTRSLLLSAGLLVTAVLGCDSSVTTSSTESAVYAALLGGLYEGKASDTLLVDDTTLSFTNNDPAYNQKLLDSIPDDVLAELDRVSRVRRLSTTLNLPRPVHLITRAELSELFGPAVRAAAARGLLGIDDGWRAFYHRYPRQRQYVGFSPVGFNKERDGALVSYSTACGGLCGSYGVVWLVKTGSVWSVRKYVVLMAS